MLKVLIVEDNFLIADLVEEFLTQHNYKVCGITNTFAKAIELISIHQPNLVILDQRLAGGGLGTDIAAYLGPFSKIGILYVTGNTENVMETAANGHGCLAKPYRLNDLLRSIEIVMQIVVTGTTLLPSPRGFQVLPLAVAVGVA